MEEIKIKSVHARKGAYSFRKGGMFFVVLFSSIIFSSTIASATIYAPGETLEPDCAPGSPNCGVVAPATAGANSNINSLSGLTTALSAPQGGTGLSAYATGDLLFASGSTALSRLGIGTDGTVLTALGGNPVWGTAIDTNIGTTDLTLTGQRTLTFDGNSLTFDGTQGDIVFSDTGAVSVGGGLTVAGTSVLSGNVGVGDSTPASLFTVGSGDLFQVSSTGAIVQATGITSSGAITFSGLSAGGVVQAAAGTGLLSASTIGAASITPDTLDFTEFKDAMTLDVNTNIALGALTLSTSGTGPISFGNAGLFTVAGNIDFNGTGNDIAGVLNLSGGALTSTGALTFTPQAGNNLNIALSATGDFALNGSQLYVDTSTGNVGVGDSTPASLFTVGSGDLFQVSSTGAIVQATGITSSGAITFSGLSAGGVVQAAAGTGLLSASTIGAASITPDTLDFTEFKDTLDLDAPLVLNQTTNTWSQTFTGTTTPGLLYVANSLTAGQALSIASSATALTGSLQEITLSGSSAANTGSLLTLTNSGTQNANTTLTVQHNATGGGNLALRVNDAVADATPFVIDGNGNVGVGTTTPALALDVNGQAIIRSAASPSLQLGDGTTGSLRIGDALTFSKTGGSFLNVSGNGMTNLVGVMIGASNTDVNARLDVVANSIHSIYVPTATGNVGIGTTTPTANLSLNFGATSTINSQSALTINSTTTSALTLDSGTTGAVNIGTNANAKTITLGNTTGTTAVNVNSGTGNVNFTVGPTASSGQVRIGNSATATPDLLVLDNGTADPTGTNGGMYYNTSTNKFRCFQNGAWTNCINGDRSLVPKTADQSVTNSTTLTSDNALTFAVGAGETWVFNFFLFVTNAASAQPDFKAAVLGAAGWTCSAQMSGSEANGGAFPQAVSTNCTNTPTALVNGAIASDAGNGFNVRIQGVVTTTSAGNVTLQFAQNTSSASAITVKAGSYVQAFKAGGADLAEVYYSKEPLTSGAVVSLDPSLSDGVTESAGTDDRNVLGIVSTQPGMVLGDNGAPTGVPVLVALSGRVPVRVSAENGRVQPGDYLTASSTPGVAMKATKSGMIIGQVLQELSAPDGGTGVVLAFVKNTYFNGERTVDESGAVLTGTALLQKMLVDKTLSATAAHVSEMLTDRVSAGLEIVTPKVITEELLTDTLKPSLTKELAIQLGADGQISVGEEGKAPAATIDALGNATFAGTLSAKNIKADSIEGLEVYTDSIKSLKEKYAGLQAIAAQEVATEPPVKTDASPSDVLPTDLILKTLATDTLAVHLDASIIGKLSASGGLVVGGQSEFQGDTIFQKLATFFGDIIFKGRPTFNSDTAGFAVIAEGQRSVDITFDEVYARQPIVSVTLSTDENALAEDATHDKSLAKDIKAVENDFMKTYFDGDIKYIVIRKSLKGFTIILNKEAPSDLQFSWVALAVKGPKTFYSEPAKEDMPKNASGAVSKEAIPHDAGGATAVGNVPDDSSPADASQASVPPVAPASDLPLPVSDPASHVDLPESSAETVTVPENTPDKAAPADEPSATDVPIAK